MNSIVSIVHKFIECFESKVYRNLWSNLDDLDANCALIEHPKPSDAHRMIVIEPNQIYLTLSFRLDHHDYDDDDDDGSVKTDYVFQGAPKSKLKMYEKQMSLGSWDPKQLARQNLQNILGLEALPTPSSVRKMMMECEEEVPECGICFCDLTDDAAEELPVSCTNDQCPKQFHGSCLYEARGILINMILIKNDIL